MSRLARLSLGAAFVLVCGFLAGDAGALSPAQCSYFAVNGETTICHATQSARNPYVLIQVSQEACMAGHAGHVRDFVALGGSCDQPNTLPAGAPCDATLACSDGLVCSSGVCTPSEPTLSSPLLPRAALLGSR